MSGNHNFKFALGSLVLHVAHTKHHDGWCGHVTGREWYEDADGAGVWYYVRWITPDGKPESDKQRMSESELVQFSRRPTP